MSATTLDVEVGVYETPRFAYANTMKKAAASQGPRRTVPGK